MQPPTTLKRASTSNDSIDRAALFVDARHARSGLFDLLAAGAVSLAGVGPGDVRDFKRAENLIDGVAAPIAISGRDPGDRST